MKVLLIADVYKQGVAGEIVEVANGYARNYLIPKKLAVQATPGALKQAEEMRKQSEVRRAQLDKRLNDLARIIDGVELVFGKRASPTGKLFGSVTTTEIADALEVETGIDINRRRISQQSIREIGTHEVAIRLGTDESPVIKVTVVRQEELQSYLEQRAAEAEASEAGETVAEGEAPEAAADVVEQAEAVVAEAAEQVAEAVDEAVETPTEAVSDAAEAVVDAAEEVSADDDSDSSDDDEQKQTAE